MKEERKTFFRRVRNQIIIAKYTMARGYSWLSFLMMGVVAAVSITPYIQKVWSWAHMWQIAIVMIGILFFIGYIDNRYRFLHAEQDYAVARNPLLMRGLRGELREDWKKEEEVK